MLGQRHRRMHCCLRLTRQVFADVGFPRKNRYEEGEEGDAGWQPDPTRIQHMKSALMIQRAACLDLVGEKAFNEL